MNNSSQKKHPTLVVNGYNSTHGGGLRIFEGLLRFLGTIPKDEFVSAPVVLFSPRHNPALIDEARALGLNAWVYRLTGIQEVDQILLYFIHLPIRAHLNRQSECLLNLGDFIVPFVRNQLYYFDWLYAVTEATDVWRQMNFPQLVHRRVKRANIKTFIKTPRVVVVQSQFVAQQMIEILGRPSPTIIPCPVEELKATAQPNNPVISANEGWVPQFLCLSSFATHKNVKILLDTAEILKSRGVKARIVLTLNESDWNARAFMRQIEERGLCDIVVNAGILDFGEIDAWFEACDALLLPTKLESFGLPYVESLARGRPILTSNLPFAHEVCKTGTIFFDPDDPKNIADTIEKFIRDGGIEINNTTVCQLVEDCRPDRVYSELLSKTRL